jgi:ribosomal protein S18 acetylase RimI-like enzyme
MLMGVFTHLPIESLDSHRRDIGVERRKASSAAFPKYDRSMFEEKYGTKRFHLRTLATHPRFQRRGAAAALCRWGIEKAQADGLPVTLFSGIPAQAFYKRVGFEPAGEFELQVEGEEEKLPVSAMVYPFKSS